MIRVCKFNLKFQACELSALSNWYTLGIASKELDCDNTKDLYIVNVYNSLIAQRSVSKFTFKQPKAQYAGLSLPKAEPQLLRFS